MTSLSLSCTHCLFLFTWVDAYCLHESAAHHTHAALSPAVPLRGGRHTRYVHSPLGVSPLFSRFFAWQTHTRLSLPALHTFSRFTSWCAVTFYALHTTFGCTHTMRWPLSLTYCRTPLHSCTCRCTPTPLAAGGRPAHGHKMARLSPCWSGHTLSILPCPLPWWDIFLGGGPTSFTHTPLLTHLHPLSPFT